MLAGDCGPSYPQAPPSKASPFAHVR